MKHAIFRTTLVMVCLFMAPWQSGPSVAWADPGLLIVAHGSPGSQWNAPVFELGQMVAEEAAKEGKFKAVRTAMLEFAQRDVPTAVEELEAEGCDRIVAVPLFIAPSGHSLFDVPAVLGNYSSPDVKTLIAEEGGRIARPKVPITLTQTVDSDVLCTFALDQARKLSENPKEEALVLLAHGDADHHRLVDGLLRRVTTYCCGQAGIDYGDWAFVRVGQGYLKEGAGAIVRAANRKKRVLVVGLYVSTSASSIHRRATAGENLERREISRLVDEKRVVFSEQGLVAHPAAARWVLQTASGALEPVDPIVADKEVGRVTLGAGKAR